MTRNEFQDGILRVLNRSSRPASLGEICEEIGIRRGRRGRWSNRNYARWRAVSVELQRLKRGGKVVLVKGSGGGWRLA